MSSKLRKIIYIIKQLREILLMKEIKNIYQTLLESIITYSIIGWGGAYDNVLVQLQKCQNTIIRIASKKDQRYSIKKLYEDFNVLGINN